MLSHLGLRYGAAAHEEPVFLASGVSTDFGAGRAAILSTIFFMAAAQHNHHLPNSIQEFFQSGCAIYTLMMHVCIYMISMCMAQAICITCCVFESPALQENIQ